MKRLFELKSQNNNTQPKPKNVRFRLELQKVEEEPIENREFEEMKIEPQESPELSMEFANEIAADLEIDVNEDIVQPQDIYELSDEEEEKASPTFPPAQCSSYV